MSDRIGCTVLLVALALFLTSCVTGGYLNEDQRAAQGCMDTATGFPFDSGYGFRNREAATLLAQTQKDPLGRFSWRRAEDCMIQYLRERGR